VCPFNGNGVAAREDNIDGRPQEFLQQWVMSNPSLSIPHRPFSSPPLYSPSFSYSFCCSPCPPCCPLCAAKRPVSIQLVGLRERCVLPQRATGRSPGHKRNLSRSIVFGVNDFGFFCANKNVVTEVNLALPPPPPAYRHP